MARRAQETIEVQAPAEDVFRYWSSFQNFSSFMSDVEEVRMTGQDTSDWRVKGPLGKSAQFDARTTEMDPGRTRTDVTMNYADPPDDAVGEAILNVLPDPERNLREDLENFAKIVKRGELGGPDAQTPSR